MFLAQELGNKIVGLGIVLKEIIKAAVKVRLLGESLDQFLKIHLTLYEQKLDGTGIDQVTDKSFSLNPNFRLNIPRNLCLTCFWQIHS